MTTPLIEFFDNKIAPLIVVTPHDKHLLEQEKRKILRENKKY